MSEVVNGGAYYYLTDLRGSTVKLTDVNGAVKNTYLYDPYGNTLNTTGSTQNPIRYAGGYYDYQTNLYKFGARYYNPYDARWTQLDPSGQNPSYLYASDNPVSFVDSSGYINLDIGQLAESFVKGCVEGAVGGLVVAGVTTAATGGVGAISLPLAAAGGCILGGSESYYDTEFGLGGGNGVRALDTYLTLKDTIF